MPRWLLLPVVMIACAQAPKNPGTPGGAKGTETAAEKSDLPLVQLGIDFQKAPETIAFGSGADQDLPQPLWTVIAKDKPDLFVFMGDAVDASSVDRTHHAEQYKKLDRVPEYRAIRGEVPFLAVWNDGDYGAVDGGADHPGRIGARKEFLTYWSYVRNSIPFNQDGIHHAKTLGGVVTGKRRKKINGPSLQVILLDTRTYRSPLNRVDDAENGHQKYDPVTDTSSTLLGQEQWEWLEDQLKKPADFRIVVTPIQLISSRHGFEKWANFPHERERFFDLLRKTGAKNLVVLSGDRRVGVIAKTEVKGWGTLHEVTAGSINRPVTLEENDIDYLAPAYTKENYGLARFDWKRKTVQFSLKDAEGKIIKSVDLKIR